MSNTHFMSIGHVINPSNKLKQLGVDHLEVDKKHAEEIKARLRNFCEKLFEMLSVLYLKADFQNTDEGLFLGDKKLLMEKFDLFFQNLQPTIDTFTKFIDCILKKSSDDTDGIRFELQNQVEKVVWDKFVYMDLLSKYEDEKLTFLVEHKKDLYNLFCLFNRFTVGLYRKNIPLILNKQRANFLLQKLDPSRTLGFEYEKDVDFEDFMENLFSPDVLNKIIKNLKKLYNEYVKDLIRDEMITCRVVSMINRHSLTTVASSLYNMENCLFNCIFLNSYHCPTLK